MYDVNRKLCKMLTNLVYLSLKYSAALKIYVRASSHNMQISSLYSLNLNQSNFHRLNQ